MTEKVHDNSKEQDELLNRRKENGISQTLLLKTKSSRLIFMLLLIMIYFFAEVIVGHITGSLTLIADSFHMLSDGLALIVGLFAVRMSKRTAQHSLKTWPSKHQYFNTFGWVRFEVVGALINATFLLALCLSILMEAIEKFYDPHFITKPYLLLFVGGGGLIINIFGLFMFGGHHGHGHGHDHGHDHGHNSGSNHNQDNTKPNGSCRRSNSDDENSLTKNIEAFEEQMNMRAVFLHVLGDALGSVIVMISAVVIIVVPVESDDMNNGTINCSSANSSDGSTSPKHWIVYLDPMMSTLLVMIMITTTFPLFKKSSLILLQTVPKNISLKEVKEKLKTIEGVQEIHDFHIWQLAGDKIVSTVHLQCVDAATYLSVAQKMKQCLHDEGVHSLTIQPEFKDSPSKHCNMTCPSDNCWTKVCCKISTDPLQRKTPTPSTGSAVQELDPSVGVSDAVEVPINQSSVEGRRMSLGESIV